MNIQSIIRQLADKGQSEASPELMAYLDELDVEYRVEGSDLVLANPMELLSESVLRSGMSSTSTALISRLDVKWQIGSTNTYLMKRTKESDFHGSVCVAEQQIAGKGRRGRTWVSPFARNLYISFGWSLPRENMIEALSLYVGMNLVDCLREAGLHDVGMKWPNDILVGDGKLAGILIELELNASHANVVIGMGVNLSMDQETRSEIGRQISVVADQQVLGRNALCALIIERMMLCLQNANQVQVAAKVLDWSSYDCYSDEEVQVLIGEERVTGVNRGVDESGNLLIDVGGEIRGYSSGEVSLRKVSSNL